MRPHRLHRHKERVLGDSVMETGTCPDCGGRMKKLRYIDLSDPDNKSGEISHDWFCLICGVRWVKVRLAEIVEEESPEEI